MCGISGIATKSLETPDIEGSIQRMARSIRHRGPDGLEFRIFARPAISQNVALAHNRLAIIDVSSAGREPMTNEDDTVWLVFNGEIYNFEELRTRLKTRGHQFRSHTDAEVIIHLYEESGADCVKYLDGIFAFAILDLKRDRLFLARDPIGVKPLFYARTSNHFLFGSEIKAVLASSIVAPEPDWQAISNFFTYLYVPGPQTAFNGVCQLPPAHCLTLNLQDNLISVERYWDISRREELESISYEKMKCHIQEALPSVVKRQLTSDVPLGIFLSGGIDSTIVAGLAKREKKDIQTYTLALAGDEYRFFDEAQKARSVSRHLHTEHHELSLEFPDLLEMLDLVEFFDEPFANPTSFLMCQLSRKAREHITVALCGAGGDELFAGYPRSYAVRLARSIGWMPRPLLRLGAKALSYIRDSHQTPHLRRARKFLAGLDSDFFVQYANWTYFMTEDQKCRLLRERIGDSRPHEGSHPSVDVLRLAFAQSNLQEVDNRLLQMDLRTYLVDNILDYTDRMSMAAALEVRVPLLDAGFVEMSLNAPFAFKMRNRESKAILVNAFEEFFPLETRSAPKRGFNAPLALWAGKLFDPYFDASLSSSHPLRKRLGEDVGATWREGILDLTFIQQLRLEHRQGKRDNAHELFACIIFDVWWRKYIKRSQPIVHWEAAQG
jgi:asparagine synthase (glutamine-hydrolysing)